MPFLVLPLKSRVDRPPTVIGARPIPPRGGDRQLRHGAALECGRLEAAPVVTDEARCIGIRAARLIQKRLWHLQEERRVIQLSSGIPWPGRIPGRGEPSHQRQCQEDSVNHIREPVFNYHFSKAEINVATSATMPSKNPFPLAAVARSGWPMVPLLVIS